MCAVWADVNAGKPVNDDLGDIDIVGGRIDNIVEGLDGTGTLDRIVIAGDGTSTIDNVPIGGTTPAAGDFTDIDVDNINIDGNTIISSNTNGDINITPNGTGKVVTSKMDINGGAIDGTPIGAASTSTGAFSTINVGAGGAFKVKLFSGTSSAGGVIQDAHSLTVADIVSITGIIRDGAAGSDYIDLGSTGTLQADSTNIDITSSKINSAYRIMVTYV